MVEFKSGDIVKHKYSSKNRLYKITALYEATDNDMFVIRQLNETDKDTIANHLVSLEELYLYYYKPEMANVLFS